jgi:peptide/nickel transport system ATP-binding protein
VALACALAGEPDLLIADETTSALDTVVQARIVDLLDRLVRDKGMALLFITHDIALAARLSSRIVVLDAGLVAERLEPGDRLASATHPATRALLDAHVDLATPPLIGSLP